MWRTATKPINDETSTFRGWLLTQTYRIDGVGQLARRVAEDSCLGRRVSAESVRHHTFAFHSAAPPVSDAFTQAIKEWQRGNANVGASQTDRLVLPPKSLNPVSPAGWSGHVHTWAERGRSLVNVLSQSLHFGDIVRRSVPISRRAGRALRRTPPVLANLLWTNREPRTRSRTRRTGDIGNRYRHVRSTGTKRGNGASSAGDRWYERAAAGK
jgi:hypothetical protein